MAGFFNFLRDSIFGFFDLIFRTRRLLPSPSDQSLYGSASDSNDLEEKVDLPKVTQLDLQISFNTTRHHTSKYEFCYEYFVDDVTDEKKSGELVVRRGQEFEIQVTLNRPYRINDSFKLIFELYGEKFEVFTDSADFEDSTWSAKVKTSELENVVLKLTSHHTCSIGRWSLKIKGDDGKNGDSPKCNPDSYDETAHFYLIFNPWAKDDAVYMGNQEWRDEYVLNDSGKIYVGTEKQMFGKPWNFGQFDSVVLRCACWLLENRSTLSGEEHGDPILLTRQISALLNSVDENGVLEGRWQEPYDDGATPTSWNGSVKILKQFMRTQHKPVKYGQCWVFSGIVTTICRSLGIPARSVTNFSSAHDGDRSLTIDVYVNEDNEVDEERSSDSTWNFHVWNEAWMTRPDLRPEYSGWQAIDSTPQEPSYEEMNNGIWCTGPAPIEAIKYGDVEVCYDTKFVFSEVNADKVYHIEAKDGEVRKKIIKDYVGKCISTKAVGVSREFSRGNPTPDREDITHQYKFPECSSLERAAVYKAALASTTPETYYGDDDELMKDVKFEALSVDEILVGSEATLKVMIKNSSDEERNVTLKFVLALVYYNGTICKSLSTKASTKTLKSNESTDMEAVLMPDLYLHLVKAATYRVKVTYVGLVEETKQTFLHTDVFRFRTPVPDVKVSKKSVKVGQKFKVTASMNNPIDHELSSCVWSFEAAVNLKPVDVNTRNVGAKEVTQSEYVVTAKRPGLCVVIVGFECDQMSDVQGQANILISDYID